MLLVMQPVMLQDLVLVLLIVSVVEKDVQHAQTLVLVLLALLDIQNLLVKQLVVKHLKIAKLVITVLQELVSHVNLLKL